MAKSYFLPDLPPPGREAVQGPIPKGPHGKPQEGALPSESWGQEEGGGDGGAGAQGKPAGSGLFPTPWCLLRQFLGLHPHQGSIKLSGMCGPRVVLPASDSVAIFFNHAHRMSKCPNRVGSPAGESSKGLRLRCKKERPRLQKPGPVML